MKTRLDQIEARLRTLIESSSLLLPWSRREHLLARRLVDALRDSIQATDTGSLTAAGVYSIFMHPTNLADWQPHKDMFDALARALQEAAEESKVKFSSPPVVRLVEDAHLGLDEVLVVATPSVEHAGSTASLILPDERRAAEPTSSRPNNAFLIINGTQMYQLDRAVVNIGRKSDNHLVLDDPRISRNHAQLRAVRGQFVLFDLNSTGGTFVNGLRVTQYTLKPGDVISLAGVALIYGQESPSTTIEDTSELPLASL